MQLLHLFSGDNNLVLFHLWWMEIMLKEKKALKNKNIF